MRLEYTMKSNKFIEIVEKYETIALFRHQNPDGDALGSQVGLALWLKKNYPKKTVYMLGSDDHNFHIFPKMDQVDDLGDFLAIVLDTANRERIDDERYQLAQEIIKIDHHPVVDKYGDLRIVDSTRGSCCEIVADMLQTVDEYSFDEEIASKLLAGILTDTIRFSIETTSSKTLRTAAFLIDCGANITKLNQELFTRSKRFFELRRELSQKVQWVDKLAYIYLSQKDLAEIGLDEREAKIFISIMADIREVEIWLMIIESEERGYTGSIRSRNITINTIAQEFNGGGHRLASGVSDLTKEQVETLIDTLAKASLS
ncbi:MAG TPA: bifunctional oligoribonuclease/PAP phosphatase NrnA [Erysipelothrix sp.]